MNLDFIRGLVYEHMSIEVTYSHLEAGWEGHTDGLPRRCG